MTLPLFIAILVAIALCLALWRQQRARRLSIPLSVIPVEQVIEAVSDPLLIITAGRVAAANAAARELLGGHITGEDVRVAIRHPAASERLSSPMTGPPAGPAMLVGLGKLDQQWEMNVTRVGEDSRVVHLVDRTSSRSAERARVDFVANASHELRTPLAAILGFVETLRDEVGDDPDVRARFLRIIYDEAARMEALVSDLMSLSRIEAEKYRAPADPVSLAELAEQVAADYRRLGTKSEIRIETNQVADVAGDRGQLSQLVHNLVGNGIKYGREATPIAIRVWQERPDTVRFSVTDEGEGIPAEHLPRLTERFYRVDSGRSRRLGGTGLGLAIVKHIVERHRGRLEFASVVGQGTTVTVTFPAAIVSRLS